MALDIEVDISKDQKLRSFKTEERMHFYIPRTDAAENKIPANKHQRGPFDGFLIIAYSETSIQ